MNQIQHLLDHIFCRKKKSQFYGYNNQMCINNQTMYVYVSMKIRMEGCTF